MEQELALTKPQSLKLYEPGLFVDKTQKQKSPNEWFVQRYKLAFDKFGSPFLELHDQYLNEVHVISINLDFFAAVLGGRRDLGHHVIYLECEMQWYFKDSDGIYKPTSPEKMANLCRALMVKCAQDMPANVHKLNLFHEWRSDKTAKAVVQRAKSVLAADRSFFSTTSLNQRIRGIELHERLARRFVDELLTSEPGQILMLQDAYAAFCSMIKRQELNRLKRSDFKAIVTPLIRDEFNVGFRNDLVVGGNAGIRGWKNVRLQAKPG
jgi:hypothetical protein